MRDSLTSSESLEEIKTIVYSDVEIDQEFCYGDGCSRYCGDGECSVISYLDVNEKDENNIYNGFTSLKYFSYC